MEQEKQDFGYRRARINRLKRLILIFIFTAWMIPTVLCIYVLCSLHSQQKTVGRLETIVQELSTQLSARETEMKPETETAKEEIIETENETETDIEIETDTQTEASQVTIEKMAEESDGGEGTEGKKRIYLTFDDGPSVYTQTICDILGKYQIKATFFVNGKQGEWADEALRRIVNDGHTLGMHSYSHQYDDIYNSVEDFAADFEKIHEHIYQVTGYDSHIYRFPGGSSTTTTKVDMQLCFSYLQSKDTVYFDWNISSKDATKGGISASEVIKNCTGTIPKYDECIILCHDAQSKATTVEALPLVIEKIMETGDVEFLPLSTNTTPIQFISMEAQN